MLTMLLASFHPDRQSTFEAPLGAGLQTISEEPTVNDELNHGTNREFKYLCQSHG